MLINSEKGFTLIEIMLALAMISIITVGVASFSIFSFESFNTETNYIRQLERIQRLTERMGKEIEEAQQVEFTATEELVLTFPGTTPTTHTWRFNGDALQLRSDGATTFQTVVDGLVVWDGATQVSYIRYYPSLNRVVFAIRPRETNTGRFQGKNIQQTKVIEYSIRYKL